MRSAIGSLILTFILGSIAFSAEVTAKAKPADKVSSEWCVTKKWITKAGSLQEMRQSFDNESRENLVQMFWGEALDNKPRPILVGLAQYLAYTEQKSAVSGYYQTIAVAAGSQIPLGDELEKWPKVSKLSKVKSKLNELCQLYLRAGGDDFK